MAYVVTDACVRCKNTECVAVCPVDCFYEGVNMLVIHPDECIDCGACESECPETAIFEEADIRAQKRHLPYISINSVFSGHHRLEDVDTTGWPAHVKAGAARYWPNITNQKDPMPGYEKAAKETNKIGSIDPRGADEL